MENEFNLQNPSLENEAKLTVSLEQVESTTKLRMEVRNLSIAMGLPTFMSGDQHLNYHIGDKSEVLRLASLLTSLADQM
mgnify:CR=1 FL=1